MPIIIPYVYCLQYFQLPEIIEFNDLFPFYSPLVVVHITHIPGISSSSLPPYSNKLSSASLFNAQPTNA